MEVPTQPISIATGQYHAELVKDWERVKHDLKYVDSLLQRFGLEHPFPVDSPAIDSLTLSVVERGAKTAHILLQLLDSKLVPSQGAVG
jgi:hypothetical protein